MDTRDTSPNISADDVTREMEEKWNYPGGRDFTVSSKDMERYQAVHEDLFKQIRYSRLEEVWSSHAELECIRIGIAVLSSAVDWV
jgi:hypothetical protein